MLRIFRQWFEYDGKKTHNDGDGRVCLFFCVPPAFAMILFDYTVVGCIVAENNYDEYYCDDAD